MLSMEGEEIREGRTEIFAEDDEDKNEWCSVSLSHLGSR